MLRVVVTLVGLFQIFVPCYCTRLIPVYDIRTKERFAFPEDFIKVVLEYQGTDAGESQIYIPEYLDDEGYIINEDGQLVPFRLYKKGNHGSRVMCFLHPRNCRGGFHKRLTDETAPEDIPADLYKLHVYKRKHQTTENHENFKTSYRIDNDVVVVPGYKGHPFKSQSRSFKSKDRDFESAELDGKVYDLYPPQKTDYYENDVKQIGISESDMETLQDMKEANLLLHDLSRGLGQVADPPPLETGPHIKAEVEEYPDYEFLDDYDNRYRENADRHKEGVNVLSPGKTVDFYAFRRRM